MKNFRNLKSRQQLFKFKFCMNLHQIRFQINMISTLGISTEILLTNFFPLPKIVASIILHCFSPWDTHRTILKTLTFSDPLNFWSNKILNMMNPYKYSLLNSIVLNRNN